MSRFERVSSCGTASLERTKLVSGNDEGNKVVASIHEEDGSVTARDRETGLAGGGATRGEALTR